MSWVISVCEGVGHIAGETAGKYDKYHDLNGKHLKDTNITTCWGFIVIVIALIIIIIIITIIVVIIIIIIIITPWSRVLLEKLTCALLVKKFPTFYGTQKFITAFTEPATSPYPKPDEPSPCPPPPIPHLEVPC